jgi:TonB family protein
MRAFQWCALVCVATSISCHGQNSPDSQLPGNPREVLSLAAPFYNFSDPSLMPWHLKATYQLYDEAGMPASQGTYEYWWASPTVYRSTWVRGDSVHTDWHTSDGKHFYLSTGQGLEFFEFRLQSEILTPLPEPAEYDPAATYFDREVVNLGSAKVPCIMIVPKMPQNGQVLNIPLGMFPTYCFDPKLPVLIMKTSFGALTVSYGQVERIQNRYLPKVIDEYEAKRRILEMTVDTIQGLKPDDPALIPAPDAKTTSVAPVAVGAGVMAGHRIGGPMPVYPQDAKDARAQGTVVLKALIGRDGKIHDLKVISAAYPSLVASAMWAVSQWKYKPYLLNGEPVDVDTQVNVTYNLGD